MKPQPPSVEDYERRLRDMSATPLPPVPASVYQYLSLLPGKQGQIGPGPFSQRRIAPGRWLVRIALVGTAVVLAVALGSGLAGLRNSAGQSSSPSGTAPSNAASPTASVWPATTTPGIPAGAWVRANQPAGTLFTAMVTVQNGFLAFGIDPASAAAPSLWRSENGLEWRRLADSPAFVADSGYEYVVASASSVGNTVIAVGTLQLADASRGDAATWYSTDGGQTWRRGAITQGTDAAMLGVADGPTAWAAVGSDGFPGGSTQQAGSRGAAIWTSAGGAVWNRATGTTAFAGAMAYHVVPTSAGWIASGAVLPGRSASGTPIWSSDKGTTWQRVKQLGTDQWLNLRVLVAGSRLFALGSLVDGTAGIWTSMDGSQWQTTVIAPTPGPGVSILDIEAQSTALVAIGQRQRADGQPRLAVWRSDDGGLRWQERPDQANFDAASGFGSASGNGMVVVFGQPYAPAAAGPPVGYVWLSGP